MVLLQCSSHMGSICCFLYSCVLSYAHAVRWETNINDPFCDKFNGPYWRETMEGRWSTKFHISQRRFLSFSLSGRTVRFSLCSSRLLCLGLHWVTSCELESLCLYKGHWFNHVPSRMDLFRTVLAGGFHFATAEMQNKEEEHDGWLPLGGFICYLETKSFWPFLDS